MRFTSVCFSAPRLPTVIESAAIAHIRTDQRCCMAPKPTKVIRSSTANAAALGAVDIKPTTGEGAPWYTSGVHTWNGAADTLNPRPMMIMPSARNARCGVAVVPRASSDGGDRGRPGRSEGQRDAIQEERRRKRTQQEILQRSLDAARLALAEACQDVRRDRRDLEADEHHQQLDRAGHQHHARRAEENQREVLAGMRGVAFKIIERAQQRDQHDAGNQQVEEDRERVHLDGAREGGDRCR